MLKINIPGRKEPFLFEHLVLDLNGTLATDGILLPGVKKQITGLSEYLTIYILTADTFGTAGMQFKDIPCKLTILKPENQVKQKEVFVKNLGAGQTIAIGNGINDTGMLRTAALGICILGEEGTAIQALMASDIVIPSITSALDLLLKPKRMVATLRK